MINILIVDDSSTMRKLIKKSLESIGYGKNIQEASNGLEGLKLIEKDESINCVFLDINMPIMSGFEMLHQLKEKEIYDRVDVILASTEILTLGESYIDELNVTGVIPKPFKKNEFDLTLIPLLDMIDNKYKNDDISFDNEILIVDDSISMRKIVKRQLQKLGCKNFYEAENGRKALEVVAENMDINLMFVDINMPLMNGNDLILQLDKTHLLDTIKVVMISNNEKELKSIVDSANVLAGILKPFKQEDLNTIVLPILNSFNKDKVSEDKSCELNSTCELIFEEANLDIEELDELEDIKEIKLDYSVEDSIEIYLQKYKGVINKNPKLLNAKKLEFSKMKRFVFTAYNHLIEMDVSLKSNKVLNEALRQLRKIEELYKELIFDKQASIEVIYKKMFLKQQSLYLYFNKKFENLGENIDEESKKAKALYSELKRVKKEIEKIENKGSIEYLKQIKIFKELNSNYANTLHKITFSKNDIKDIIEAIKKFKEQHISLFETIYMDKLKIIEAEFIKFLDAHCYLFDYILWDRAKNSISVRNFFSKSEIVGNYSSQTFLEHYLRSIDKSKTDQMNLRLFDLLDYLRKTDNRKIAILGDNNSDIVEMRNLISTMDRSYKAQGFANFTKLIDGVTIQQDLLIIDYQMKNFKLYEFLKEYKRVHKIKKDEKIKVLIIFNKYNKEAIIQAIESGILDASIKNYLIKPKHLHKLMLMNKVNSLV